MDRQKIENAIDALVSLLDHIDGDENEECNGDLEPYLAGDACGSFESDRELDNCDDEPYLAATGQVWHSDAILDVESSAAIAGGQA